MTRRRACTSALVLISVLTIGVTAAGARQLPRLEVSENKRFLVTEDARPFFWLADTAWELFHRLNRGRGSLSA